MDQDDHLEDYAQTDSLADLTLTGEHAGNISAGRISPFGGFLGGVYVGGSDLRADADLQAGQPARSNRNNS